MHKPYANKLIPYSNRYLVTFFYMILHYINKISVSLNINFELWPIYSFMLQIIKINTQRKSDSNFSDDEKFPILYVKCMLQKIGSLEVMY